MLLVVFLGVGLCTAALLSVLGPYVRRPTDLRARRMAVALRGSITMPTDREDDTR
jgi:hypothetical protein